MIYEMDDTQTVQPPDDSRGLLPSILSGILLGCVFGIPFFYAAGRLLSDPDIFWHVRTGQFILDNGFIPRENIFAQEPGMPSSKIELRGPIEVIIKEPVKTDIQGWSAYPSQAIRVKIDDPWPAKIRIDDEVKVKGELRLQD